MLRIVFDVSRPFPLRPFYCNYAARCFRMPVFGHCFSPYAGDQSARQLITQRSGTDALNREPITSLIGDLLLVFTSDQSISKEGFVAYFAPLGAPSVATPLPAVVGSIQPLLMQQTQVQAPQLQQQSQQPRRCIGRETLTSLQGALSDGPDRYLPGAICSWAIRTGFPITLTFVELDTESSWDVIKVYDGDSNYSPQIAVVSGRNSPPSLTASSGSMLVFFTSDSSIEGTGFSATYTSGPAQLRPLTGLPTLGYPDTAAPVIAVSSPGIFVSTSPPESHSANIASPPCRGTQTLTTYSGEFASGPYFPYTSCSWLIQAGQAVAITILALNLEAGFDFIKLYDGPTFEAPLLASLSGSMLPPQPILSTRTSLLALFTSDASQQGSGFRAEYIVRSLQSLPLPLPIAAQAANPTRQCDDVRCAKCNGVPFFPNPPNSVTLGSGPYQADLRCSWLYCTSTSLALQFDAFSIERSYDTITVYSGSDANAPRLATLTGLEGQGAFLTAASSSSGCMFVTFSSDSSVSGTGFLGAFTSGANRAGLSDHSATPQAAAFAGPDASIATHGSAGSIVEERATFRTVQPTLKPIGNTLTVGLNAAVLSRGEARPETASQKKSGIARPLVSGASMMLAALLTLSLIEW